MKKHLSILLFLVILAAWAAGVTPDVTIIVSGDTYTITGTFGSAAPVKTAWDVLTDYNHLSGFVSSMRLSRGQKTGPDTWQVDQQIYGSWLVLEQLTSTSLDIHEQPPRLIMFTDTLKKDFNRYEGQWLIEPRDQQTRITYQLRFIPRFFIPPFINESLVRDRIRQLLLEVYNEMDKRSRNVN